MRKFLSLLAFIAALTIAQFLTEPVFAQTAAEAAQKVTEIQSQIDEVQRQLNEAQTQAKTLGSQLKFIDTQTQLTQLKVEQTNYQIIKLTKEIEELSGRIGRLSGSVDSISEVLLTRIVQTYKYGKVSPIDLFFSSKGFSDLLEKLKYIEVAQANDKKVLYQLQATKAAYNDQKSDKETRQTEQNKLKLDLEKYQTDLADQKNQKSQLLNAVKNDEAKYEARIADLQKEINQIQNAAKILIDTTPKKVARGDIIGIMGSTGYSTGDHLHFGVYNASTLSDYNYYSNYENPANVLQGATIQWWDYPDCNDSRANVQNRQTGSGSWQWPISTDNLFISQGFGDTCFSGKLYGGRPHPALDMYRPGGSVTVHAVEEGQAYFCRNCLGDGGNGVFLFHSNGKMTLYWHLR